jgi:hypothetical protein
VPKAPVKEDGHFRLTEDEIGASKNRGIAPPTRNTVRPQQTEKPLLGRTISPATDRRHIQRSLRRRVDVRHVTPFGFRRIVEVLGTESDRDKMCRPIASAKPTGTAFPICAPIDC